MGREYPVPAEIIGVPGLTGYAFARCVSGFAAKGPNAGRSKRYFLFIRSRVEARRQDCRNLAQLPSLRDRAILC